MLPHVTVMALETATRELQIAESLARYHVRVSNRLTEADTFFGDRTNMRGAPIRPLPGLKGWACNFTRERETKETRGNGLLHGELRFGVMLLNRFQKQYT